MLLIDYPALQPYAVQYDDIDSKPLRVTLTLRSGSRIAGYDPINLDNLLARAVVDEATGGQGLPNSPLPYRLPVPLACLWRSEEGLPLWAATQFRPESEAVKDVAYWHKRVQPGRFTGTKTGNFSIRSTNGRYMERRVPLPTVVSDRWIADALGDPDEIARLLSGVTFVGKRRTNGFGEVERWQVEPIGSFELMEGDKLLRPIPAAAVSLLAGQVPDGQASPIGWTPPQWMPALFRPGWWSGTPVQTDWYEAVSSL